MPVNKRSKSAPAAKQAATKANDNTEPPSSPGPPTTPRKEKSTPSSHQVNRAISRASQQNTATAGTMSPSMSAHGSPRRAGPSSSGNAQLAAQARQPFQIFSDRCSDFQDNFDQATFPMPNSADSSAEIRHGFGALGQRPDQGLDNQSQHHMQAHNLLNYEAPSMQNYYNPQNIHHNYHFQYMQNFHAHPQRGTSQFYYETFGRDPGSQQNDTTHDTKSIDPDTTHAGPPGHKALGSVSQVTTTLAGNSMHAGKSIAAGATEPAEPAAHGRPRIDFQDEVNLLVQQVGMTEYSGRIQDDMEAFIYRDAIKMAKARGKKGYDQKCDGYPADPVSQRATRKRIFEAIVNLGGEQDKVSIDGILLESLAVKEVRSVSPLEIELVVHDLMDGMRKVQSGIPVAPANAKVVQEDNFSAKLNAVVKALNSNKSLCKSVIFEAEQLARVVADPAGERIKKIRNNNNNIRKSEVLSEASQRNGTARKGKGKGKGSSRGKGKRPANDEAEAESEQGGSSTEAVVNQEVEASQAKA